MIKAETKIRVRYGETDRMGYAYHGVYAQYFEIGRVDAMRTLGFSYREVEEKGIMMPVVDLSISYRKPAFYDDELTLVTVIRQRPGPVRLIFDYECYNAERVLISTGQVTLVTVNKTSGRICRLPDWFEVALDAFYPRHA